ncbi:PHP domain-containing protein [bacterium]|nr:PHP domain-containing protein [bacterium]
MFTHLHIHSHYSLLDGASSPEELCQQAAELEYTSLALTDTNNLYGALSFTAAAKETGINLMAWDRTWYAAGSRTPAAQLPSPQSE